MSTRSAAGKEQKTEPQLLFVYGTLMRGGGLHHLLGVSRDSDFIGEAQIHAKLYLPEGENYPGAVLTSEANRFVFGELYAIRDSVVLLARLDDAEGCEEGLFERRRVDVFLDGRRRPAWSYLYAKSISNAKLVSDGRFKIAGSTT